jgi:FlaA1/EpsC-like NDP-sugar epimerase
MIQCSFSEQPMKRILITGAAGAIGQILRAGLAGVSIDTCGLPT